ncbi:MAG: hypothetical protein ABIP48_25725 [Planctomycetota bacterium]
MMNEKEILAKVAAGELSAKAILAKVAAGELSADEAEKLLAESPRRSLYCKVSQKGGLSLYGLQRMPVTLYVEQWERLLDFSGELRDFMKEHDPELKRKER